MLALQIMLCESANKAFIVTAIARRSPDSAFIVTAIARKPPDSAFIVTVIARIPAGSRPIVTRCCQKAEKTSDLSTFRSFTPCFIRSAGLLSARLYSFAENRRHLSTLFQKTLTKGP